MATTSCRIAALAVFGIPSTVVSIGVFLAIFLVGGSGCSEPQPFRVSTVQLPEGVRNQPIRVEFSRPVHRDTPLRSVMSVSHNGGTLSFAPRVQDRVVYLDPDDPLGWPADHQLKVEIKRGHAAALRSSDGQPLVKDVSFEVAVGQSYQDLGVPFLIEPADVGALVDVGRDFIYRCRFTLPIDRTSFERNPAWIRVQAGLERGAARELQPDVSLSADGRTLDIRPWPKRTPVFDAGREHRLEISSQLQSITGRTLGRPHTITFLATRRAEYEGYLDVSFAISDLMGTDNPLLMRDAGFARPQAQPLRSEVLFDDVRRTAHEVPFSKTPARLLFRMPGEALQDESGLVTGFAALTPSLIPKDLVFPRIIVRIGYAVDNNSPVREEFDLNYGSQGADEDGGLVHETVARGGNGEWRPPAGDGTRWIDFWFERPFFYKGRGQDLILEIRNERGCFLDTEGTAAPHDGFRWLGGPEPRGLGAQSVWTISPDIFAHRGHWQDSVFATKIHIERYIDIESPWYEAEISDPRYWLLPAAGELDAEGTLNEDFRLKFRGMLPNGELTEWTPLVTQVSGCKKIKVKVSFLPNSRRRLDMGPEVRRVRVRYRQAK